MGSAAYTLAENQGSSLSTWIINLYSDDIFVSDVNFYCPVPKAKVKYSGGHSSKNYAITYLEQIRFPLDEGGGGSVGGEDYLKPNQEKELVYGGRKRIDTSEIFNSSNKTEITATLYHTIGKAHFESGYRSGASFINYYGWYNGDVDYRIPIEITLSAPPTFETANPTSESGYFVVGEDIDVNVFNVDVKYGGDIKWVRAKFNNDSVRQSTAGIISYTPTQEGTYNVSVEVEDSRGQVSTKNLGKIIVYDEAPEWIAPYFERTSVNDKLNDVDMTRIATDCAYLGCQLTKLTYNPNDITRDSAWNAIVEFMQEYDPTITYSADWQNLNKIEYQLYLNYEVDLSGSWYFNNEIDIANMPYTSTDEYDDWKMYNLEVDLSSYAGDGYNKTTYSFLQKTVNTASGEIYLNIGDGWTAYSSTDGWLVDYARRIDLSDFVAKGKVAEWFNANAVKRTENISGSTMQFVETLDLTTMPKYGDGDILPISFTYNNNDYVGMHGVNDALFFASTPYSQQQIYDRGSWTYIAREITFGDGYYDNDPEFIEWIKDNAVERVEHTWEEHYVQGHYQATASTKSAAYSGAMRYIVKGTMPSIYDLTASASNAYFEMGSTMGSMQTLKYYSCDSSGRPSTSTKPKYVIYVTSISSGRITGNFYRITSVSDPTKGDYIRTVTSYDANAYPDNGIQDDKWYVKIL